MPSNYRIFYALKDLSFGTEGSPGSGFRAGHGIQSTSLTTTFNLEQVFELGQLDIYESIEGLPNVELQAEKVLDGYPLLYHLASPSATSKTLLNRTNGKCDVVLSLFSDGQDNASGTPLTQVYCSGMFIDSLTYTFPVQGNCTESITLVGNDKLWKTSAFLFSGHFDGTDSPPSGTQRRQHVKMGAAAVGGSVWPTNLPGVTTTASSGYNIETAGQFGAHIQDVSVNTSLGRQDILELGRRKPYYRYASIPVTVTTTINMNVGGSTPGDLISANSETDNLTNQPIVIRLADATTFHLGNRNKLSSVSQTGGNTDGGLETASYSFQNFNRLDVTSISDPNGLL